MEHEDVLSAFCVEYISKRIPYSNIHKTIIEIEGDIIDLFDFDKEFVPFFNEYLLKHKKHEQSRRTKI